MPRRNSHAGRRDQNDVWSADHCKQLVKDLRKAAERRLQRRAEREADRQDPAEREVAA